MKTLIEKDKVDIASSLSQVTPPQLLYHFSHSCCSNHYIHTYRVANVCIISTCSFISLALGPHTAPAYPIWGHAKMVYALVLIICCCSVRRKPERRVCFIADVVYAVVPAEFGIFFVLQDIFCLLHNLGYDHTLICYEIEVNVSLIYGAHYIIQGGISFATCSLMKKSLCKSCWREAAFRRLEIVMYTMVSSANRLTFASRSSRKSM